MRLLRSRDYHRMPWKNGGGETVEIAISPEGASLDAFDWRISMAHVASSGPFSRFPDIDRTLAVLSGAGIRLAVAGRGAVPLGPEATPFSFRGDDPAEADLIGGPIDDLNVMTRRASHRHRLMRFRPTGRVLLRRESDLLLVMVREAPATARIANADHGLDIGDTLLLDRENEPQVEIVPGDGAVLYLVEIWRA